jgi:1-phosphatidylinositol phosphodiesterase
VFHGVRSQRTKFTEVLSDLDEFLTSHPGETVIMSIKDELRSEDFSRLTWLDMDKYYHRWFFENRVPTLDEVRGKVIVMGRFWISESRISRIFY